MNLSPIGSRDHLSAVAATPSPSSTGAVTNAVTSALGVAIAAEHAAIFGYGAVGAHLDKATQDQARQAETAHRNRRDVIADRIRTLGGAPPVTEAAYTLPFAVTDRASALRLAIALEEGTGRAWRAALLPTSGDDRRACIDALTDTALRATRWRRLAGVSPAVVALPGAAP